jgi:2-succinyl-6-hydroxy-2,4-cyclohexadiene-1-carboxylate synthase
MTTWNEETHGDPEHPAVLFLHGFMGRGGDWTPIVNDLKKSFYCICLDFPGHGENATADVGNAWSMDAVIAGLIELLDKYDLERCALVGYSMGGRLALHLAVSYPERFTRIVLESASPGLKTEKERKQRRRHDDNLACQLEAAVGDPKLFREFLEQWSELPIFASLQGHPALRAKLIENRLANDPERLAASLRAMGSGAQTSLWEQLAAYTLPTLLMVGALERKFGIIAEEMSACCPMMAIEVLENCGHNVHFENPSGYTTVIKSFLAPLR